MHCILGLEERIPSTTHAWRACGVAGSLQGIVLSLQGIQGSSQGIAGSALQGIARVFAGSLQGIAMAFEGALRGGFAGHCKVFAA
eukprot:6175965-Pyramimonas_sp.AAC.1